ncbi:hypothetical protein O3P69_019581 [Scylla paramamosain]|uniref:Phosphodiesterase n=1 Tax=Scylla paramamosain TaxID=85552 RepID=A0AAW0SX21_SCYPA
MTVNINNVIQWLGAPLEDQGLMTHSVLTIPIFNASRKILGVAQLINKVTGYFGECMGLLKESGLQFSDYDISTFEAFAIFCGLGIQNTQAYEKACRLMARQQVALECLSYHATAAQDDTERLKTAEIPTAAVFDLYNFDFCDNVLTDDETCKCVIRMFMDLHLLNTYHIPYETPKHPTRPPKHPTKHRKTRQTLTNTTLTGFVSLAFECEEKLSPSKIPQLEACYHCGPDDVRYAEDWEDGAVHDGLREPLLSHHAIAPRQMLGLLVACLCHDLDHRGTNNSFQTKTDSPLAILYSTSTMEHHHFDQCVMILSQDSNNIFQCLQPEDYRRVMTLVENAILSTDMAMYFKKKNTFLELSDNGEFDWQSEEKKNLLCGMMMTACDVSAIAKPWEVQHKTAKLVADEFFEQGDLERLQLNEQPIALSESFPWVKPLYDGCASNLYHWKTLAEQVDMGLTWIDHEYIDKPVERNNRAAGSTTSPSPPKVRHPQFDTLTPPEAKPITDAACCPPRHVIGPSHSARTVAFVYIEATQ